MPPTCRTNRHDPDGLAWDGYHELLATLVEEVSRLSRPDAPLQINRPWQEGKDADTRPAPPARGAAPQTAPPSTPEPGMHQTPSGGMVVNGMAAMIQLAAGQGHTVRSTDGE